MTLMKKIVFCFAFLLFPVYYSWLIIWWNEPFLQDLGAAFLSLAGPSLAALSFYYVYKRSNRRIRTFWFILFIGMLNYILAELIWGYYELYLRVDIPFPGWFDLPYLLFYLLFFAAIIYKINQNSFYNLRLVIDALFFCIVIMVISWIFIFAPLLEGLDASFFQMIVTVAYPALDIAILFALVNLLILTKYSTFSKKVFSLFIAGILLFVVLDFIYFYAVMYENVTLIYLVSPVWTFALMLLGLAALYDHEDSDTEKGRRQINTNEEEQVNIHFRNEAYIQITPIILLALLFSALYYNAEHEFSMVENMIFILLLFLIIRQIIYIFENKKNVDRAKEK